MKAHTYLLPVSAKLFWTMGKQNLSIARAVAEFVDNSIDARVEGFTEVRVYLEEDRIVVEDNSSGMSIEELVKALTPAQGTSKDKSHVGGYGFGLKTASAVLGNRVEIVTAREDSYIAYNAILENPFTQSNKLVAVAETEANNEWGIVIREESKSDLKNGTRLVISDLNIPIDDVERNEVFEHFAKTFGNFILNKQLELYVDDELIEPFEFDRIWHKDFEITVRNKYGDDCKANGWVGITRVSSNATTSKTKNGFHLYINGRLVKYGVWYGVEYHNEMRLLTGEIYLENFEPNLTKTEVMEKTHEWKSFLDEFSKWFKENRIRYHANMETKELTRKKKEALAIEKELKAAKEPSKRVKSKKISLEVPVEGNNSKNNNIARSILASVIATPDETDGVKVNGDLGSARDPILNNIASMENTTSENTTSENTTSENAMSENTTSENTTSENTTSENTTS
ncbi:ATP-binding protein, partial [Tumebacillus flagellatus]|uniref:ATP-binding protein n=1 Tax=Tumebacillus flagellatus TaxID=1157490 RepID=UPI0015682B95